LLEQDLQSKKKLIYLLNFLFKYFIKDQIIFNSSWEDPAIDRKLLNLDNSSEILTITSAGDNILDYLLDSPKSIASVDLNPSQTALAELKLAIIKADSYDDLFKLFGNGHYTNFENLLVRISPNLSSDSFNFWAKRTMYFNSRLSFYHYGTSGLIARGFHYHQKLSPKLRRLVLELADSSDIKQQHRKYKELESLLFDNWLARFLLDNRLALSLFGIPDQQYELVKKYNEYQNIHKFIVGSLSNVFKEFKLSDNYFWYLYINGMYSKKTCPNYLKESNFELLKANASRVTLKTDTFYNTLKVSNSNIFSHIILLDHFDWFWKDRNTQFSVWKEIQRVAKPNAKILFRSAASRRDYLIPEIRNGIEFRDDLTDGLNNRGRVGTYGSVNFGIIKPDTTN